MQHAVYVVTYNATDSAGNAATEVTRNVEVIQPTEVWVDFQWPGTEKGTEAEPFKTVARGIASVTTGAGL